MRKNSLLLIIIFLTITLITACSETKTNQKVISNNETVDTSQMQVKHCTRSGNADNGLEVELNYELYYTGENLNILKSTEKVIGDDKDTLKIYKDAYKNIHKNYAGLEYYDTEVIEDSNSVTSTITINYDKIDIEKLLEIEGEEDNIIENGQAKIDKWLTLAKKFGTKCKDV